MFNLDDWKSVIADYVHTETGNDDFVFGNYIDWDSFRRDHGEDVLNELSIDYDEDTIEEELDKIGVPSDYWYENGNPNFPAEFCYWQE